MASPGTYDINYYKGDTYEFYITPKTTAGTAFNLTGYTAKFFISDKRGTAGLTNQKECYVAIDLVNNKLLCVIRPADSTTLIAGTSYVYDVEITKTGGTYPLTYTLLTGNITVTDQVSGAA